MRAHGRLEVTSRPLKDAEKRLLRSAISNRRERLRRLPIRMVTFSLVVFGILWGLTIFATIADKKGPSWLVSGLIWGAICFPLSVWSYLSARKPVIQALRRFESALQSDTAVETRIRSREMVEFEELEDEGACYAFQVDQGRIVFVTGQEFYASQRFPTSDFSIIDIRTQGGSLVEQFVEKREARLEPLRKIPAHVKYTLKIPENLRLIQGNLADLERLLA